MLVANPNATDEQIKTALIKA